MSTSIEDLVSIARNSTLTADVFKCFADVELEDIVRTYGGFFRLQLTDQVISDRSVVLAAAHFVTLHGLLQRNMSATAARQSTKGTPISPLMHQVISSEYGGQHWMLTSYGIEYQQLQVVANQLSSLAFGI